MNYRLDNKFRCSWENLDPLDVPAVAFQAEIAVLGSCSERWRLHVLALSPVARQTYTRTTTERPEIPIDFS